MKRYVTSFLNRESLGQLIKVGIIGVGNTAASFVLFNLFLTIGWSSVWSVTAASTASTGKAPSGHGTASISAPANAA